MYLSLSVSPSLSLQVKVKLPVELEPSHHLLFTFSHIACDVQKATKVKSSAKLPPVETIGAYMSCVVHVQFNHSVVTI